jgi:DNA polymerase
LTLEELAEEVKNCRKCPLFKSRTQVVFGVGSPQADLIFVGEAPGYYEDVQGEPFVGPAGKLLDKMINRIGLTRSQVYIANVIKCRPPNNRDPLPLEVETCLPYLGKQIEIIKPKVVCALGNHAARSLLKKSVSISRERGRKIEAGKYYLFLTYHPAAILRNANLLPILEKDFDALGEILKEPPPRPEPSQMSLF